MNSQMSRCICTAWNQLSDRGRRIAKVTLVALLGALIVIYLNMPDYEKEDRRPFQSISANPVPDNIPPTAIFRMLPVAIKKRYPIVMEIDSQGIWPDDLSGKFRMDLFEATAHCLEEDRLGKLGDGGKFCCGLSRLKNLSNCVVYSMGSRGEMSFENDIQALDNGNCEIHTFDTDPQFGSLWEGLHLRKMYYHPGFVTPTGPHSLRGIMKSLGHDHIDILKMDIEGSEYGVLREALNPTEDPTFPPVNIGQLLVEVHEYSRNIAWRTYAMLADLEHAGLYEFHSEINPYQPWACRELAFINVTYSKWL